MGAFVALRVKVRKGETNRAALYRELAACRMIVFPVFIPTPSQDWGYRIDSRDKIPTQDFKVDGDYIVKYERA